MVGCGCFKKEDDFLAFEEVLLVADRRAPIRILDYCLMPDHWHLVVGPGSRGVDGVYALVDADARAAMEARARCGWARASVSGAFQELSD